MPWGNRKADRLTVLALACAENFLGNCRGVADCRREGSRVSYGLGRPELGDVLAEA